MIPAAMQLAQHPALSAALLLLLFQTPKPAVPFTTPLTPAEMAGKQAVVATSAGTFVIDLRPDLAPNHVGYFIKLAKAGTYDGTIFHRVVRLGIIQGGDPLSKDRGEGEAVRHGRARRPQGRNQRREAHERRGVRRAPAGQAR